MITNHNYYKFLNKFLSALNKWLEIPSTRTLQGTYNSVCQVTISYKDMPFIPRPQILHDCTIQSARNPTGLDIQFSLPPNPIGLDVRLSLPKSYSTRHPVLYSFMNVNLGLPYTWFSQRVWYSGKKTSKFITDDMVWTCHNRFLKIKENLSTFDKGGIR